MALSSLQPMMADFMETLSRGRHGDAMIVQLQIEDDSPMCEQPLSTAFTNAPGTVALAIRRANEKLVVGPTGVDVLHAGDTVIVLGDEQHLEALGQNNR